LTINDLHVLARVVRVCIRHHGGATDPVSSFGEPRWISGQSSHQLAQLAVGTGRFSSALPSYDEGVAMRRDIGDAQTDEIADAAGRM
jgi:hypothetical protein